MSDPAGVLVGLTVAAMSGFVMGLGVGLAAAGVIA